MKHAKQTDRKNTAPSATSRHSNNDKKSFCCKRSNTSENSCWQLSRKCDDQCAPSQTNIDMRIFINILLSLRLQQAT